ncbi:MAG TPA: gamma-glutamylcyclotransferase family protein [Reyranella sp.]|jgi:gamma-glutamylcyclotransferase (GGCT)/AIG2-like uncharacterized protein YtfP|nr:gamma-glutamylcyclotransferase family protein [Reyranella sp.]
MQAGSDRPLLYFAYGSNMSAGVLAQRLPRHDGAPFRRRRAVLADHKLMFHKVSSTDPAVGYADVVPQPGQQVEGILVELGRVELQRLDEIELVPHHYARREVEVLDCDGVVAAHVYTAQPGWIRPAIRPLRAYLDNLLGGADLLSPGYVAALRAVPCRD